MLVSLAALAGLAGLASAASSVLDLIPSNFDAVVLQSGRPTLVEFFAPWCGHCKNLAPVYEELAAAFAPTGNVQIAKVDADAERALGKRFGVQGFPTLKFFDGKSKEPIDYRGGRDLESLSAFLTEKTGVRPRRKVEAPSQVQWLTDANFDEVVGGERDVVVAFTAPWCGHCKSLAPVWEQLAVDFENEPGVLVAKVDGESALSKKLSKNQGLTEYPTIKFFRRGSTVPELYFGGRSEEALVQFVNGRAGTHRVAGGGLDRSAGTIAELDALVAQYVAGRTELASAAGAVEKAANVLQAQPGHAFAEYYVRVFGKLGQNAGYVAKELARLEGILAKGGLASAKADELTSKVNILRKFTEQPEPNKYADDEAKEAKEGKDEL